MATLTPGTLSARLGEASDRLYGGQQDGHLSVLSSQMDTLNMKQPDRDTSMDPSEDVVNAEKTKTTELTFLQPQTAQNLAISSATAPSSLTVNGLKYVLDEPGMVIPAMINAPDSVQQAGFKSLKRMGHFTAGNIPVTFQPSADQQAVSGTYTSTQAQAAGLIMQPPDMSSQPAVTGITAGTPVGDIGVVASENPHRPLLSNRIDRTPGQDVAEDDSYYE